MRRFLAASAALTLSLLAVSSAPAVAGEILTTDVTVADAVKRSCIEAPLTGGKGYATRSTTVPGAGFVTARLAARSGDWDLALFDSATGERVAGSAGFGAGEIAQGFVTRGGRLTVQACRRSGTATSAGLTLESEALPGPASPKSSPSCACPRLRAPARTSFPASAST